MPLKIGFINAIMDYFLKIAHIQCVRSLQAIGWTLPLTICALYFDLDPGILRVIRTEPCYE